MSEKPEKIENIEERIRVEGAVLCAGDREGWIARLIYKCPHCNKRHTQKVEGQEPEMPRTFITKCKTGFGEVEVIPYHSQEQAS